MGSSRTLLSDVQAEDPTWEVFISPFMGEKLRGEADYQFIAVEPASCPSLTRGVYAYDYCDTGMVCPLSKMYTLGSGFIPSASHAGGLRYHGMSSVFIAAFTKMDIWKLVR